MICIVVQDLEILRSTHKDLNNKVREGEEEVEKLLRELELEQAEIEEIEASDKSYLQELKESIKDQE
jgi:vacuolar-type H+-ATPase subunit I/STV1